MCSSDLPAAVRTPVTRSPVRSSASTGVCGRYRALHAGTVVLATGVWSPPLLRGAGIDLPIETERHTVAVLAHPPGGGASVACIDSVTGTYFRPEASGTMTVVGEFTGERGVAPDQPATASIGAAAPLAGRAAERVPALADAGIARGITGVYDMTPDARPMLGPVPGAPGLVLAAGLSGTGFKISPAVGESLAAMLTGGGDGAVDLAPFRPGRFADGQPIEAPYPYSDD